MKLIENSRIYVYFGGKGVLTRLARRDRSFRIGDPENVRIGLVMLDVWEMEWG